MLPWPYLVPPAEDITACPCSPLLQSKQPPTAGGDGIPKLGSLLPSLVRGSVVNEVILAVKTTTFRPQILKQLLHGSSAQSPVDTAALGKRPR